MLLPVLWGVAAIVQGQGPASAPALPRDLVVEETRSLPSANKRWALIVGVDQYEDPQVTPLRGAANDAKLLGESLVRYAGFPEDQVIVLSSGGPEEVRPSRANILLRLANLAKLVPNDGLLLFSFAGHGMERSGQVFLLPSDSRMSNNVRVLQQTALNVGDVKEWIVEMGVKQVLLMLDACRNDPVAGRSASANTMTDAFRKSFDFDSVNSRVEAFATLYATKVGARAYEYAEKRHGYFTWAVVEGLRGGAANDAGEITLASLQRFVQDWVPRRVSLDLGEGADQRPFADIKGYRAEELVLARAEPRRAQQSAGADPKLTQLADWERIAATRDVQAMQAFVARYPNSPLADQALHRIASIAWETARDSTDPKAVRGFLANHGKSAFAGVARKHLENLQTEDSARGGVLEALGRYRQAFEKRDADQLAAVVPTLGKRELGAISGFFKMARSVNLDLVPVAPPEVAANKGSVTCRRELRFSDDRGPQKPNVDLVAVRLRREQDNWVIESVDPVKAR